VLAAAGVDFFGPRPWYFEPLPQFTGRCQFQPKPSDTCSGWYIDAHGNAGVNSAPAKQTVAVPKGRRPATVVEILKAKGQAERDVANVLARTGEPRGARAALELAAREYGLRLRVEPGDWLDVFLCRRRLTQIDLQRANWPRAVRVFLEARDTVRAAETGCLGECLDVELIGYRVRVPARRKALEFSNWRDAQRELAKLKAAGHYAVVERQFAEFKFTPLSSTAH
jgi:hypothetical protein